MISVNAFRRRWIVIFALMTSIYLLSTRSIDLPQGYTIDTTAIKAYGSERLKSINNHHSWIPGSHHVFIASYSRSHEEIFFGLASSLSEMGVESTVFTECDEEHSPQLITNGTCLRFDLNDLVKDAGIIKGRGYPQIPPARRECNCSLP